MILELSFKKATYHYKKANGELCVARTNWFDALSSWLYTALKVEVNHCKREQLGLAKGELAMYVTDSPDEWTTFIHNGLFEKVAVRDQHRWIYTVPNESLDNYIRVLLEGVKREKMAFFQEAVCCLEEMRRRGMDYQPWVTQYLGATLEHLTLEQRLEAEKKISDSPILVKAANRLFSEKAKVKFYESKGIKKTA